MNQLAPIPAQRFAVKGHVQGNADFASARVNALLFHQGNVINHHYKFVDGTSFAAPIVASIVACMLEANPKLTPQQVKRILIDTAERVPDVEVDRQGWGVVVPRQAVHLSLRLGGRL